MPWEENNLFYKKELWFLQTYLTTCECKNFKSIYKKKNLEKLIIENLLKKIVSTQERLEQILSAYENFSQHFEYKEDKFMSVFELEFIMNKKIHENAPLALQFAGRKEILSKPLVAIIGSRHPTFYGREQAFRFAHALSSQGCTIVSGGAIGIDSIASSTAMEQNGGSCVILGSGLSSLYPPSNIKLFHRLKHKENGLLLSEFSEKYPAQKWNFPKRNHTIALLVDFVLIIEAANTSGSLITAHAALDYGTDVGAIPGYIDCSNSEGSNALIQNGAFCIQKPQDVLERVEYIYKMRAK